ncbi:retrovirus-related Pol polyprotein from transposon 17.6 [Trichonephila clavipes]|nr:retrovirus-related Pol polyprotein from transposon 17.6 [Trichonephila clavipes]
MQADQWMTPDELRKACDIFFISKNRSLHDSRNPNTFKSKNDDVYSKNRANMGYTNQFQRQFPKHNQSVRAYKTVSCYICGDPHFERNCMKKTMNSEKRNTDTGHAVNQIETSISNQNNFLFIELQYVDVIVDHPTKSNLELRREFSNYQFKEGAKLELHTDACKLGLGAVLLQQGEDGSFYPIHYMSKKTSIQEEKLCSYELEVLAVIEALKKFRNYLLGRKFRIQTDCAAFAKTLDKKELTPKMARWSIFLTDFDYEVDHSPAKQMQHVDASSRHPVMLVTSDELTYKIVNAQESDKYIRTIKKLLQEGKASEIIVSNKILYKISEEQKLPVVPEMMQVDVIKKAHSFRHFAVTETEELIGQQEDARGEWENLPPKTEKAQYQKGELVATVKTQFGNKMKPWTLH